MLEIIYTDVKNVPTFAFEQNRTAYIPIPVGVKGSPYFPKALAESHKELYLQYAASVPSLNGDEIYCTLGYNEAFVAYPLIFIYGEDRKHYKDKLFYFIKFVSEIDKNITIIFNHSLFRPFISSEFCSTDEFDKQYGGISDFILDGQYGSTEIFETDLEIFLEKYNIENKILIIEIQNHQPPSLVDDLIKDLS